MTHPRNWTWIVLALLLLAGCAGPRPTPSPAWQMTDLRVLEAPNQADPAFDMIAAYARQTQTDLELRLDLLGSPDPNAYDLYILLDTAPGGGGRLPLDLPAALEWEILLRYPAVGLPSAISAGGDLIAGLRPRILRDGMLDCVTVRVSKQQMKYDSRTLAFQAFLVRRGESHAADAIGPSRLDGPSIGTRAPAYLAFWDVLPAATPAQALRRWDGAHTGPYGQRHGLAVLLSAAQNSGTPLTLLDLARPDRLAALDTLGGMPLVRRLARENVISIAAWGSGAQEAAAGGLEESTAILRKYRLPHGRAAYGAFTSPPEGFSAAFAHLEDSHHLIQWETVRLLPLPEVPSSVGEDLIANGLPLETRLALLTTALSTDPSDVVALGGSLPTSAWGDQAVAAASFAYLAGHPWIQVLSAGDLLSFPSQPGGPDCSNLLCSDTSPDTADLFTRIQQAPHGLFHALADLAYRQLTGPESNLRLSALRQGYLPVMTGPLLAAAEWEANPVTQSGCTQDIDADGMPECILASSQVFAVLDPQGARLLLLAMRKGKGVFQVVGPRAQFALGLGDPSTWSTEPGRGDPQDIPGAFTDPADPWKLHQAAVAPGEIRFSDSDGTGAVTYRLENHALRVEMERSTEWTTSIPLALITKETYALGGYQRYSPGAIDNPSHWSWSFRGGPVVEIQAETAALMPVDFHASLPLLGQPEDPDLAYPPAFSIPFPMAVVTVSSPGSAVITISAP